MKIIVRPNSKKEEIIYDKEKNIYRVSIKAPPEKGKANLAVKKLFKKLWKKEIEIIAGYTFRKKIIKIIKA